MKAPSPLIILLFSLAIVYRGFVAFFPFLRGKNKKKRKPVPRAQGIVCFLVGAAGLFFSSYVLYVFAGGQHRLLPITDKTLFFVADMLLFAPIVFLFVLRLFTREKKSGSE